MSNNYPAILSVQSHVAFGYVGNKAAVYPLQSLGFDVWPVNTVQFSNHTGYGSWTGEIFSKEHIKSTIEGILKLTSGKNCQAILSGYLGNPQIGEAISWAHSKLKEKNSDIIYLCDPVMGDIGRGVFVSPQVVEYFRKNLKANIITPNQFEAELLSGISIKSLDNAKLVCDFFHSKNIDTVLITSLQISELSKQAIGILISHKGKIKFFEHEYFDFKIPPNGTGDLFSALFLGYFLKTKDPELSAEKTISKLIQVIKNTYQSQTRELQVLSVGYDY